MIGRRRTLLALALGLALAACGGATPTPAPRAASPSAAVPRFRLTSAAFANDQPIPVRYTCDGQGLSPPLAWDGQPPDVASYALVVDDPDARGDFTHWLLVDLPGAAVSLPEGVPAGDRPPVGGVQGKNDFGKSGYGGPCPPAGAAHHYHFTLYALDATLGLAPGVAKPQVLAALNGHILAEAQLVGAYRRQG
ncbi:MAG TPA: YbhB/YbcL family Raf kinase inhibitor-like protein [Thermomicrobiales bacterium]|nr:YbhB/YbcL family Raf kinase inhibitor-like protein [Thermomicrobiales bacterium]